MTAGMLVAVGRDVDAWTPNLRGLVILDGVALLLALAFAAAGLFPRTRAGRKSGEKISEADVEANLLFFGDVSRIYKQRQPSYRDVLASLTSNPAELTAQIADQIYANSKIASTKFFCVNWAIRLELSGALLLSAVVVVDIAGV
ncbi:Pycsar system effector family protein [Microbacterium sp. P03]|uniref:Pycsar system effector family protein n=1 Tax=Microbacterium sp. P03 TaxID=3366946 RepID=UPI003745C7AF